MPFIAFRIKICTRVLRDRTFVTLLEKKSIRFQSQRKKAETVQFCLSIMAMRNGFFCNRLKLREECGFIGDRRYNFATVSSSMKNDDAQFRTTSVNPSEAAKFAAMADTWWDREGPFKPLHSMNPTRVSFIRTTLCRHFRRDPSILKPFRGLKIADIGCGGGLLCEPLARLGATVTGVDAVEKNINIARLHSATDPSTASIQYRCVTAEELVKEEAKFDAVISLEVVEHVANPQEFVKSLGSLTSDNGALVLSTMNRSIKCYLLAIIAAEYILGLLPRGTHDWSSFITPVELSLLMKRASITVDEIAGMVYDPLWNQWELSDNTDINYIAFGTKSNH